MTEPENDGIKALYDSYTRQELELRIRELEQQKRELEQQKKAKEAKRASDKTDVLAKQTTEKLKEYAPAADEIVDSPSFKKQCCNLMKLLIKNRDSDSIDFILDALCELLGIKLPVKFVSLASQKLIKIGLHRYCNDDDLK